MSWRRGRDAASGRDAAPADGPEPPAASPAGRRADAWDAPREPGRGARAPAGDYALDPDALRRATSRTVTRALAEDLGDEGDLTTLACVPAAARGTGRVVARAPGTVAGTAAMAEVFHQVDPRLEVDLRVADGDEVHAETVIAEVTGSLRSVLTAERTALNLLGRLSGIATLTAAYVAALEGTGCRVRDTRKTTPGLRVLEKAAVLAGGGANHRTGLHDGLLVKDNHAAAAGGVHVATEAAVARADGIPVQVEVRSIDELEQAIAAGARDVLADNLDVDGLRRLVNRARGRVAVEASGGITLDTVRAVAETGVDRVAVGAITHSAPALDVALDIVPGSTSGPAAPEGGPIWEQQLFPDGPTDTPPRPPRPEDATQRPTFPSAQDGD